MNSTAFHNADILIPNSSIDMSKWAVIACDQYTSDFKYWDKVQSVISNAPSTLNLILPELYLEHDDVSQRIDNIHSTMDKYIASGIFKEYKNAMIYVERVQSNGMVRKGIIGAIDLEKYDFYNESSSEVRSTEATVIERIPPRIKIRQDASLELTHIIILIDDSDKTVIENIDKNSMKKIYDTKLMQNSGSICGYLVDEKAQEKIDSALLAIGDPNIFNRKYGLINSPVLLYAIGDGNHSLATAKMFYEQLKNANPDKNFSHHPARYALAEIVNINSEALQFEAIYRLVYNVDCDTLITEITKFFKLSDTLSDQWIKIVYDGYMKKFYIHNNTISKISVINSIQNYLDNYIKYKGGKIDYIHGVENIKLIAEKYHGVAFIFQGIDKSQLFPFIINNGVLPKKTFSIGSADDKRFYIEARKIM